jgi:hypothetical protein
MTAAGLGGWVASWWWTLAAEPGHASAWHLAPSSDTAPPSYGVTFDAPGPCTFHGTSREPSRDAPFSPHCLECQRFCSALPPSLRGSVRVVR